MSNRTKVPARRMKKDQSSFTLEEKLVLYYRKNPVQGAHDLLCWEGKSLELTWWQRITLRAMWSRKFVFLLWARAVAKTFTFAVFCILYGLLYPKTKIGIFGPTLRQANYTFEFMDELVEESPFIQAGLKRSKGGDLVSIRQNTGSLMEFKNGSKVESLPIGDGTKIRGKRYHIVLIDEYAQMDEEIVGRVIRPFLMVKKRRLDNRLIIGSTAYWVWNHAWRQYVYFRRKEQDKDPDYFLSDFDYIDVVNTPDCPFEYDMKMLEAQKEFLPSEEFGMEYLNLFPRDTSGYIPASLIDACTPKDEEKLISIELAQDPSEKEAMYFIGIDPARAAGRDNFAMEILKYWTNKKGKKQAAFINALTLNGATYPKMKNTILDTLVLYKNTKRIHMDAAPAGGGLALKDLLAEQILGDEAILDIDDLQPEWTGRAILRMITPSLPVNNELAAKFKAGLQQRKVLFPLDIRRHTDKQMELAHREMIYTKREIIGVFAEPTHSGRLLTFKTARNMRKDRWSASVLAYNALYDYLMGEELSKIKELPIGHWL